MVIAPPVLLIYFTLIGGSPAGELLGWLRVVNGVLAGAFIVIYIMQAPRRADQIDGLVLVALLLTAVAAVLSEFSRQSLDALLAGLSYAAVFFVARGVLRQHVARRALTWGMMALCAVITLLAVERTAVPYIQWWILTDGAVVPPIGLPFDAWLWGHRYDFVILAVMLYPSWLVGSPGRLRLAGGIALGIMLALVVLLLGSRAVWVAVAGATVLLGLSFGVRLLVRGRPAVRVPALTVLMGAALLLVALSGPILDRLLTTSTVGQRLAMWSATTEAWLERPLAGYGPGSFPWVLQTTSYFDMNSIHPRHPDSALFQLLPEAGLLGIAAAVCVLVAVVVPMARHRVRLALWPIAVFVLGGIGGNPTDFSFLIVIAIVWAAYGLPRLPRPASGQRPVRHSLSPIMYSGLAVIAIAYGATLAAGVFYDGAIRQVREGNLNAARADLGIAMTLDPGMALYARQRGVAQLLLDEVDLSVADLRRATEINPNDDLSWRALAIAYKSQSRVPAATEALGRAIALQRSDPTNLLLSAAWQSDIEGGRRPSETIGELVLAWPTIVGAPGWEDLVSESFSSEQAIALALDRWEQGAASPEPLRSQPFWLAVLAERPALVDAARRQYGPSPTLAAATVAVHSCEPDADERLAAVPRGERDSSAYLSLVIRHAAEQGDRDDRAHELYEIRTGSELYQAAVDEFLNPLHENNPQGSVDAWGYDRLPIAWDAPELGLPSPAAGAVRWLLDPTAAREALGLSAGLGSCQ